MWSTYQQNIFSWVDRHVSAPGALVVEAVAGSGKTTTIVEAAKHIPHTDRAVFLAFNKSIATELSKRLPGTVESKTLNALGFGAVRRRFGNVTVDADKTRNIIRAMNNRRIDPSIESALINVIGKAKSHGVIPVPGPAKVGTRATFEVWAELVDRYDIEVQDIGEFATFAEAVLRASLEETKVIDFDDMMYLVVALDLGCSKYNWLIVDEAQDVSHVQRAMLHKFLAPDGRLVAVGDSKQAIYGFRGADSNSMEAIRTEFNADTLPLSITYRCPRKVVELAQQYVPHLQARDDAPDGTVRSIGSLDGQDLNDRDLVLCRYTAPILSAAYNLIHQGIPVRVQGRDIGVGLKSLIKRIGGKYWEQMVTEVFLEKLGAWQQREFERLSAAGSSESKLETLQDKVESLRAVAVSSDATNGAELVQAIDRIFSSTRGVLLSTVHRAKGLEAPRVFILAPESMPSKRAKQAWQLTQEYNLIYVAYTRALSELVFVSGGN